MKKKEIHHVPEQEKAIRLSDYAIGIFESISSRKGIKKAIDSGRVWINGEAARTSKYITGGETIVLYEGKKKDRPVYELELAVLFEDDHIAVVEKPSGIIVSGNQHRSIENALPKNLGPSAQSDALDWPQPVHRLDFPTSGLLLIGKTRSAVTKLGEMFKSREIDKEYLALTKGKLDDTGVIDTPIKEKSASTRYEVVQTVESTKYGVYQMVKLFPSTGRRHQLRIHLSGLGHPILGDKEYGEEGKVIKRRGFFLHATALSFVHPFTNEKISLRSVIPVKFERMIKES